MSLTNDERKWIEGHFDGLRRELVGVQIAVAKLTVKAGIWGVFGGAIPIIITAGIYIFLRK